MIRKLLLFVFVIDLLFHFSQVEGIERLLIDEIGEKWRFLILQKGLYPWPPALRKSYLL